MPKDFIKKDSKLPLPEDKEEEKEEQDFIIVNEEKEEEKEEPKNTEEKKEEQEEKKEKALENVLNEAVSIQKRSFEEYADIAEWLSRTSEQIFMDDLRELATIQQEKPPDAFETLERVIDTADRLKKLSESSVSVSDTILSALATLLSNPNVAEKLKSVTKLLSTATKQQQQEPPKI